MNHPVSCRLCGAGLQFFSQALQRHYWRCSQCLAVQMDASDLPDPESERQLYLTHNNDVDDPRYRRFVSPITQAVLDKQTSAQRGLDFGAGTGPVITQVLREQGYEIAIFDSFFHPETALLERHYDYIVCCEVIEHFHQPAGEFSLLKSLLAEGGKLYCMTERFKDDTDFDNWYYKNDPTHVFFYHRQSFEWIRERYGFSRVSCGEGRLVTFSA